MSFDRETKSERGFSLYVSTLALVVAFIALIAVAFKVNSGGDSSAAASAAPRSHSTSTGQQATGTAEEVSLVIKSDEEHAKKGPEGEWHDAYLPADFTIKAGATVQVVVQNYDEAGHTFTASGLGTNQMIAAGSATKPSTTTFTFTAPAKKGQYEWHCMMPCDPWAMAHDGFMTGFVTVA